jgi:transcriptional regulator with XRE-family HTH domain
MGTSPVTHDAHDYAERVRERLPRKLQELREAAGLSKYALAGESGISREFIGKVERGEANPSVCVTAQLSFGMGMTLSEFAAH